MPNFGHFFPRSSYVDGGAAPGTAGKLGRSLANSSDVSLESHTQSDDEEQQFVLSGANTPAAETVPMDDAARRAGIPALRGGRGILDDAASRNISTTRSAPQTSTASSRHNRARPIAIELPASARSINTAPTQPEPLSARGDLLGGYFPLHEDPKTRVYRPHPFHLDAQKARSRSISLAAQSCSPQDDSGLAAAAGAMSDSTQYPLLDAIGRAQDKTHTPVASYMPSGHHDVPLPMGKYYPSNYESRTSTPGDPASTRPAASKTLSSPQTGGNMHLAIPKHGTAHFRSDSDAKRRLQQYQRDMVAQAALGAREVIGGAGPKATAAASAYGVSLRNIQLPTAKVHKPTSPRLAPLGSPGPVTPMDLEENGGDGGYLTRGHVLSSPDAEREHDEVKRAMRADEERRRREGATSPAVEFGTVIF